MGLWTVAGRIGPARARARNQGYDLVRSISPRLKTDASSATGHGPESLTTQKIECPDRIQSNLRPRARNAQVAVAGLRPRLCRIICTLQTVFFRAVTATGFSKENNRFNLS